jgi:hypothetical protein
MAENQQLEREKAALKIELDSQLQMDQVHSS